LGKWDHTLHRVYPTINPGYFQFDVTLSPKPCVTVLICGDNSHEWINAKLHLVFNYWKWLKFNNLDMALNWDSDISGIIIKIENSKKITEFLKSHW